MPRREAARHRTHPDEGGAAEILDPGPRLEMDGVQVRDDRPPEDHESRRRAWNERRRQEEGRVQVRVEDLGDGQRDAPPLLPPPPSSEGMTRIVGRVDAVPCVVIVVGDHGRGRHEEERQQHHEHGRIHQQRQQQRRRRGGRRYLRDHRGSPELNRLVSSEDVEQRHDREVDRSAKEDELSKVRSDVVDIVLLLLSSSSIVGGGRG